MDYYDFSNKFLPIALHTADLGNPVKPIKYYNKWVDNIMKEFFHQGDKERELKLNISMLCDRFKVNIHAGQVGFINFVIRPWYERFGLLLKDDKQGPMFLQILDENFVYMKERANQSKEAQDIIKQSELKQQEQQQQETQETQNNTETEINNNNDTNDNNVNNNTNDNNDDNNVMSDDDNNNNNNDDVMSDSNNDSTTPTPRMDRTQSGRSKKDFQIISMPLKKIHSKLGAETSL